jgi:hypothetical protein
MITQFIVFVAVCRAGFFPSIPAFWPVPLSENIPVQSHITTSKMESVPCWEFQCKNSPEDQQNFREILAYLFCSLISFLISFMVYHLYYRNLRQGWYREDETKQELSQLKMLLQKGESLILEVRGTVMFMEEMEDRLHSQFQNQTDSIKKMMQMVDENHLQLQNEMNQKKTIMNIEDECLAEFQNEVGSMEEDNDGACFQNEVDSMMPTVPVEKETPRKNCTTVYTPAKSRVEIYNEKLNFSQTKPKVDCWKT